jgi:membrane protein required for colicin V production
VDIAAALQGITVGDLILLVYFVGFFVLGFAQGVLRRLLGIGSILFSFLLAASVAQPLSEFLADNWTQFPAEYSYMIGFLTIFVAGVIAFALVIQTYYEPQALFKRARYADEIIGGLLGLLEAALLFGVVLVILDSFFAIPGFPRDSQELPLLRGLWEAIDATKTAEFFRSTLIPAFFFVFGFFVPDSIEAKYPRT